jgi:hypothetical protein
VVIGKRRGAARNQGGTQSERSDAPPVQLSDG